jgi:hypothetical protein
MPSDAQVFCFPRRLTVFGMVLAFLLLPWALADPGNQHVVIWGWLMFACIPACIVLASIYAWRYSLVVGEGDINVGSFSRKHFLISEITAINVWIGKGARNAVITFKSGEKVTIPSFLDRFDQLVALLRKKAGLAKPVWE